VRDRFAIPDSSAFQHKRAGLSVLLNAIHHAQNTPGLYRRQAEIKASLESNTR